MSRLTEQERREPAASPPEPQAAPHALSAVNQENQEAAAGARLVGIDMLRGAAAVSVLLFHALGTGMPSAYQPGAVAGVQRAGLWVASYGFIGVYLFFVISGFCIHLKWAKACAQGREAALDVREFFKRRVRRLYPAYLAAIALSILMLAWQGTWKPTPFNLYDVAMHLLLIHNLDVRIVYSFNGVFWTLAVEAQLYMAYFALLWMRKRWSWPAILLFCLALRVVWFVLSVLWFRTFQREMAAYEAAPSNWLLWVLGALSAEAAVGACSLPRWCRSLPLAAVALAAAVVAYYLYAYVFVGGKIYLVLQTILAPLWAFGFFLLLNAITAPKLSPALEKPALKKRVAEKSDGTLTPGQGSLQGPAPSIGARALALVGLFSYSIYLTHQIIFSLLDLNIWVKILLVFPFSWGFFLLFEKPFLSARPSKPQGKSTLPN